MARYATRTQCGQAYTNANADRDEDDATASRVLKGTTAYTAGQSAAGPRQRTGASKRTADRADECRDGAAIECAAATHAAR